MFHKGELFTWNPLDHDDIEDSKNPLGAIEQYHPGGHMLGKSQFGLG